MTNSAVGGASFFVVFFIFFRAAAAIGSASPVAIVGGSGGAVCGVLAGPSTRGILCASGLLTFQLLPNISFVSVAGGRDFLCALRSGGTSFLCWGFSGENPRPKRVFNGPSVLSEFTVGESHVAASVAGGGVRFWRGARSFPSVVDGNYKSLTSGDGFSCGIRVDDGSVRCWGEEGGIAGELQSGFENQTMDSLVAGESHACGITTAGLLLCRGRNGEGQLNSPREASPFEFAGLAMGRAHSCAIRRENGAVVCWGAGAAAAFQAVNESMEWIAAGGDLTCGVATVNFSVICWAATGGAAPAVRLRRILPGVCTGESSCGSCGQIPDSQSLCGGSGVICQRCDDGAASPPPPTTAPPGKGPRRGLLAFAIVGSVGAFAGVCVIGYLVWKGACRQKRVHNSVQLAIVPVAPPAVATVSASQSRSRSRSMISRRLDPRVMSRQRSGPSVVRDRPEEFTFEELAAATNNFAPEMKIGSGSFGTVYTGKLADGREVAIKRGDAAVRLSKVQEKESAFQSELVFLSRLHHKHLVELVGFCEDDDERLLVYELMPNGALYDLLHARRGSPGASSRGGEINSWKLRVKVLLDAARGIEYLHSYAVPPIIHRDIKSANILLDASWTAKVSDFGLSLSGPKSDGGHLSLKAAGTVGYMDPEYYGLQQLTVKSDVYGLGVVMLEVLTGKRAIFKDEEGNPNSVVDYAVPHIVAGDLARVLDARVGVPPPSQAEAVELLAYVAARCVSLEGRERPTMTDIVANLENALALCDESRASEDSGGNSIGSDDYC
ncbi:CRINKLY4 related 3 [Wolffia australiana]